MKTGQMNNQLTKNVEENKYLKTIYRNKLSLYSTSIIPKPKAGRMDMGSQAQLKKELLITTTETFLLRLFQGSFRPLILELSTKIISKES